MKKRLFSFLIISCLCAAFLSAENVISDYTLQKVEEFVTYRVTLKSEDHEIAYKKIDKLKKEALAELSAYAKDYEQEKCLLESVYYAEYYEHALNADGNQKVSATFAAAELKHESLFNYRRCNGLLYDPIAGCNSLVWYEG